MPKSIYIVDDEENILEIISFNLEKNGYSTKSFATGQGFIDSFNISKPDLVILDLMLPDIDGYDICKYIKNRSDIPVIILSAKGEELDKVLGLELGADDYMVTIRDKRVYCKSKKYFKKIRANSKGHCILTIKKRIYLRGLKIRD